MKVSVKWLKSLVELPEDFGELTDRLNLTGTAVDGLETSGQALENIVVGRIVTREKHPDADRLWVTTVDVGAGGGAAATASAGGSSAAADASASPAIPAVADALAASAAPVATEAPAVSAAAVAAEAPELLQIVCGAQNFVAGNKVPVALVGATLPDGTRIKKAKMRGVESRGMNCSARELGLGDNHEGLLVLHPDAPVGMPISRYLDLTDSILDLEITPNRPDCMSVLGVAREIAAVYSLPYQIGREVPAPPLAGTVEELASVAISDPERCPRYTARVIKGVRIGPSPQWLAERVKASGARPINNIVDVTNYIMFETGQPLHAFDLATLSTDAQGRV
ncbi:MAG: phenylalanine--tRNA ligase subunit beta, partial [Coriobacteriales bacterium]|nr:phenylalanine--tRNA ligase subunit beta [Coriobacteriales bacterium]